MNDAVESADFVRAQHRDEIAGRVEAVATGVAFMAALTLVAERGFAQMENIPYSDGMTNMALGTLAILTVSATAAKTTADYRRYRLRPALRGGRHRQA